MNFTKVASDVQVQERMKRVLLSKYNWPLHKSKGNDIYLVPSLSFNLQPERLPKNRWSADITERGKRSMDNRKVSITNYLLTESEVFMGNNELDRK